MPDVVEVFDQFTKGKRTRRGQRIPNPPLPVVTLVAPAKIDAVIWARDRAERNAHLRKLRDEGILLHDRHRLQQSIRGHEVQRAYAFACREAEIPRIRREPRAPERPPGRVGSIIQV
jgi:hypothetical protein